MPKRAFTPGDVWTLRTATDPRLSPDGRLAAYVVGVPDRDTDRQRTEIWVAAVDGSSRPRRFTAGPQDSAPRWSPDGRSLAFVADRGHGPQIMVAPLGGGEATALTSAPHGAGQPVWSPDGRRLAFVARTGEWTPPDERTALERNAPRVVTGLLHRFDGTGWFDERRSHLFVVDAAGGEARQITDGDWDDEEPAWSPDGRRLAFTSDRNATRHDVRRKDVWVVAVDGPRRPRRLTRGVGGAALPCWSPDGQRIAYVGHELPDGDSAHNTHVMVLDLPSGAGRPNVPTALTGRLDRTVFGLQRALGAVLAWDGDDLLFLAADRGRLSLYRVPGSGAGTPSPIVAGDRQLSGFDVVGRVLAFTAAWTSEPADVYLAGIDGGDERRLGDVNATARRELQWAPTRRTSHRAADGSTVETLVIAGRAARGAGPRPAVLSVHGGPHSWNPELVMTPLYQSLAAAGYVVVLVNPRGSHGFGEEWATACVGDWGGADFADLLGALDALVDGGLVDADRIHATGYSYGGYMTSWAVGHTDRLASACVSAPVTDLVSMWGTTDIPYFNQLEMGGSLPWQDPAAWAAHSPIGNAALVTTPVQILHWEGDLRCPIGQSEELFQVLRRLGREVVLVRYPGGFHITRTPGQLEDYVARHLRWYADHPGRAARRARTARSGRASARGRR